MRAARDLTVRGGPAALTLRAVANQAGIALSNLQFHFANSDALLRAVLDAELEVGQAFVNRALEAHPGTPIDTVIDALLALQHERGSARLFFSTWAVAATSQPVRAALHEFYASWIERLGLLATAEARERVWLFVALLEGASLFRCGVVAKLDPTQDALLRAQLRALLGYPTSTANKPKPGGGR